MGPTILLDKSALQSLSIGEISFLSEHYCLVVPPTLIFEIMVDLSKPPQKGLLSKDQVRQLSQKLLYSDGYINVDYRNLCIASLLGREVPMTGQVIVREGVPLVTSTGKKVIFFDEPMERHLLRNWREGNFTNFEQNFAKFWRDKIKSDLKMEDFQKGVTKFYEHLPKTKSLQKLKMLVEKGMSDPDAAVQISNLASAIHGFIEVWGFRMSPEDLENLKTSIYNRWHKEQLPTLQSFAPYANYLLKVSHISNLALSNGLLGPDRSYVTDIQYLYYLPFCMVFSSRDDFHKKMAPLFLREDQEFVDGDILKKDLKYLSDEWSKLTPEEKRNRMYDYGSYPPENPDSITYKLWKKYMKPWKPGSGNKAVKMTKEENDRKIQELQPMFDAVDRYLKSKNKLEQS